LLNSLKVIALFLSVFLLYGCNGTTDSGTQETTMQGSGQPENTSTVPAAEAENSSSATGDAVRVARWWPNPKGAFPLAPLKGRLAVVNNCLVMSNKDVPPMLPIFPDGIGVWDDAKQTFTFKGKVIGIGETIEAGGGRILDLNTLKKAGIKYDVPDCGTTNFWLAY
jgi:hypothetical protein